MRHLIPILFLWGSLQSNNPNAQVPSPTGSPAGPTFDAISIKRHTPDDRIFPPPIERPNGGFTLTNASVVVLLNRAYAVNGRVGLPSWASTDHYDVTATSTLVRATPDDRMAMVRAMLADRFKLVRHVESRERAVYALVLARRDGRLGPGLTPIDADCDAQQAARLAAAEVARNANTPPPAFERPDFKLPPPSCTMRSIDAFVRGRQGDGQSQLGALLEGEGTMDTLASALGFAVGGVVNETGLRGSYRVKMNFDSRSGRAGPDIGAPSPDAAPSVFTALQEQLGLKLESARVSQETLVIDRLERPTED